MLNKVYVGRKSVCMADDVLAPNMHSFDLSNDLNDFQEKIRECLPNRMCQSTWAGYPARFAKTCSNECDGIIVDSANDTKKIFEIKLSSNFQISGFEIDDNWYEIIKKHPYLYLDESL